MLLVPRFFGQYLPVDGWLSFGRAMLFLPIAQDCLTLTRNKIREREKALFLVHKKNSPCRWHHAKEEVVLFGSTKKTKYLLHGRKKKNSREKEETRASIAKKKIKRIKKSCNSAQDICHIQQTQFKQKRFFFLVCHFNADYRFHESLFRRIGIRDWLNIFSSCSFNK